MSEPLLLLAASVEQLYMAVQQEDRNNRLRGHWWDHVSRVVRNAATLIGDEAILDGADVVLAAALCHDLSFETPNSDPIAVASRRCSELMHDVGFSRDDAQLGARLVEATDRDVRRPSTKLERVLYVADKLDLFGYDGTTRLLIEESGKGLTVRAEVGEAARRRQADWLSFMRELGVGRDLVERRAAEADVILSALEPVAHLPRQLRSIIDQTEGQ